MARSLQIRHKAESSSYEVLISQDKLNAIGAWARSCTKSVPARKAVIISNHTVYSLYGDGVRRSLTSAELEVSVWLMNDGERYKNLRSLEKALLHLSSERLSREDIIIALGGGVVGDLAGFAAAVYLRGIRFLQVPTTLLAMIDSSVGGKTGVNTDLGKNLVGAFHRPAGVLADIDVLKTLPRRELTAGFCEAIKHGALAGRRLFEKTDRYLIDHQRFNAQDRAEELINLIADQIAFKASIVKQDEIEQTERDDERSRKILNFGHTFAHALERVTNYRRLRHGEAVGYGILLAGEVSKNLDLLPRNELNSLYDVVHRAGRLPRIDDISPGSIFETIKFDKKSLGGNLRWVLLKRIGKPVIISETDIPRTVLTKAVKTILKVR